MELIIGIVCLKFPWIGTLSHTAHLKPSMASRKRICVCGGRKELGIGKALLALKVGKDVDEVYGVLFLVQIFRFI